MEAIVAFGLTIIVAAAMCAAIFAQNRLARAVSERISYNEAARTVLHILPAELTLDDARRDIRGVAADSVSARWYRLSGSICAVSGQDAWLRLSGLREPDPTKDSLVTVTESGERVFAISSANRDASHCVAGTGETSYRVRLTGTASAGAALVFESGSYYLSQRALRYRIGGEGRQPLTEEFMRDGASYFSFAPGDSSGGGAFRLVLALKAQSQHTAGRIAARSIHFVNGRLQ